VDDQQVVGAHQRASSDRHHGFRAGRAGQREQPQQRDRAEHEASEAPSEGSVAEQLDRPRDHQLC
jgi:hypothetical protein